MFYYRYPIFLCSYFPLQLISIRARTFCRTPIIHGSNELCVSGGINKLYLWKVARISRWEMPRPLGRGTYGHKSPGIVLLGRPTLLTHPICRQIASRFIKRYWITRNRNYRSQYSPVCLLSWKDIMEGTKQAYLLMLNTFYEKGVYHPKLPENYSEFKK